MCIEAFRNTLSATAAGALVVRAVRAAGRAATASCVALTSVRVVRAAIRTLVARRTVVATAYITSVVRGAVATIAHVALIVRGAVITVTHAAIMGSSVRLGVGVRVRSNVGRGVRCYVRSLVCIYVRITIGLVVVTYADMNVGTSTDIDRDRSTGTVVIIVATTIHSAPYTHLTVVQDYIQVASVLVIPTIQDIIKVDTDQTIIATLCPFEVHIEQFRLLTCIQIKCYTQVTSHTLCLNGYTLATTTDSYFHGRGADCGCGRSIDAHRGRHCYY